MDERIDPGNLNSIGSFGAQSPVYGPAIIVGGPGGNLIYGHLAGNDLIDGGAGNNTIYAGSDDSVIYGGGTGSNVIYGNIDDSSAPSTLYLGDIKADPRLGTIDVLVGGGGDTSAANVAVGAAAMDPIADGTDTFYANSDSNIIIGGNYTNAFNIDSNNHNPKVNIIWGDGEVSTYNFTGQYFQVEILYMDDPTVTSVENLMPSSFGLAGQAHLENAPRVVIIDPSSADTFTFNGITLTGGTYGPTGSFYTVDGPEEGYGYTGLGGESYGPAMGFFDNLDAQTSQLGVLDGKNILAIEGFTNGDFGITLSGDGPGNSNSDTDIVDPSFFTDQSHTSVASGGSDLSGGNGVALLQGTGDTTFQVGAGDGLVRVTNATVPGTAGGTLVLDSSFTQANITLSANGSQAQDLEIQNPAGDGAYILSGLAGGTPPVTSFQFADGSTLSYEQLIASLDTGSATQTAIYGDANPNTLDSKGFATYANGAGGGDTFIYQQGYGQLEIDETDAGSNPDNILQLGTSITLAQVSVVGDNYGNIYLNDGTIGDQVILNNELNGISFGVQSVQFADGSSLDKAQLASMAMLRTGTTGADVLYGTYGADTFDGKGAPAGSQDYEVGEGGGDTFIYQQGYGQLEIFEADYSADPNNVLQFGSGITAAQVTVTTDSFSNIYLTDGVTGDQVKLDYQLYGPYGVQSVQFADGSSWSKAQLAQLADAGTTGADTLYGTYNADTIDGKGAPAGSQDYEQGNGGGDTFIYDQGYGQLEVEETDFSYNPSNILQLGEDITAAQLTTTSDGSGSIVLTDGVAGDQIKLDNELSGSYYGVQLVQFADGSSLTKAQLIQISEQKTGTAGADMLYGTYNAEIFDGKGAPAGSQDYEYGGGGNDTFIYQQGYGQLEIDETDYSYSSDNVLQFGSGITAIQITISSDASGNVYLTDGVAGDEVKLDNELSSYSGVQSIQFADGSNLGKAQLNQITGTADADNLYGNDIPATFDGKGAPAGSQDYEEGSGGGDVFVYNPGYGQLEVYEADSSRTADIIKVGGSLTASQVTVTGDSSDNVYLTDGIAGDQIKIDSELNSAFFEGVQAVQFADGSSLTKAQLAVLAGVKTGTTGADTLYGGSEADTFDGKGAPPGTQDYEQGNGGGDTFLYNPGYGQLEVDEVDSSRNTNIIKVGGSLTASQVTVTSDSSNNVYLTDGIAGDQVEIDGELSGSYYNGVQAVQFADGSSLTKTQMIALVGMKIGTPGADMLYGSSAADTFDGKSAPAGTQDYEQGNGGGDVFVYSPGYGQLEVNETDFSGYTDIIKVGGSLTASQVTVTGDSSNNVYLTDGIAGDQVKIDNELSGNYYDGVGTVQFAGGSSLTQAQMIALAGVKTGTAGADMLYGGSEADTFDGKGAPADTQDYEQGNGGGDTFLYNPGYGQLEVDETDSSFNTDVLKVDGNLTASQVTVTGDSSNNAYLTDGIAGDQVKLDQELSGNPGNGVQNVKFSDGSSLTQPQLLDLAHTASITNQTLYGSGGNDMFFYSPGAGSVQINETDYSSNRLDVLQFGAGVTASQITASSDSSGNVYLNDGVAGDRIQVNQQLDGSGSYGLDQLQFFDGSSLTRQQIAGLLPHS